MYYIGTHIQIKKVININIKCHLWTRDDICLNLKRAPPRWRTFLALTKLYKIAPVATVLHVPYTMWYLDSSLSSLRSSIIFVLFSLSITFSAKKNAHPATASLTLISNGSCGADLVQINKGRMYNRVWKVHHFFSLTSQQGLILFSFPKPKSRLILSTYFSTILLNVFIA